MKVKIKWTKKLLGESEIEIDDDEIAEFLDGQGPTDAQVRDFLDAGEEDAWTAQITHSDEKDAFEEYELESVEL